MDEDCFIDYEKRSHLDENQLEYHLYILNNDNNNNSGSIDEFYNELNKTIKQLSVNYIWNNQVFTLNKPKYLSKFNATTSLYVIEGICDYGDNIDDEWFIVYLMIELTKSHENKLFVKLIDSDGDFILIHLANILPKWASNANVNLMSNRVFLCNGNLHLIPPATNPSQVTYLPASGAIKTPNEAIRILIDFKDITIVSDKMQTELKKRVDLFKDYEKLYLHQTTCTIPSKLAYLLSNEHGICNKNILLSKSINRFCDKDPSDLKLCRTLNTFKSENLVNYRVTFTKYLYCKLKYCEYQADKRHNWPKNEAEKSSQGVINDRLQLGLKLTCAFEMLAKLDEQLANINNSTASNVETNISDYDRNFQAYINNLTSLGYFKGYLKDSQEYKRLFENAKLTYSNEQQQTNGEKISKVDSLSSLFENYKINEYLAKLPNNYLELVHNEIESMQKLKQQDDCDDWLHIDQAQLDDYLEMYSRGTVNSTYDFKLISDAFKKFLDLKSNSGSSKAEAKSEFDGIDYKLINKSDEELVDFNLNSIEANLKEYLKIDRKIETGNDDDDDESVESDSFYEVNKNELNERNSDEDEDDDENRNLKEYIKSMDNELDSEKNLSHLKTYGDEEDEDDDDENVMLNLDVNLVSNALESYSSQLGLTGPVSNILKSLGI